MNTGGWYERTELPNPRCLARPSKSGGRSVVVGGAVFGGVVGEMISCSISTFDDDDFMMADDGRPFDNVNNARSMVTIIEYMMLKNVLLSPFSCGWR